MVALIDKEVLIKLVGLIISLISFMLANILLGSVLAGLKNQFNKEVLIRGFKKAFAIAIALVLIYVGGLFIPEVAVVNIGNYDLTVVKALDTLFSMAVIMYAVKSIKNLANILGVETNVDPVEDMQVPSETEFNDLGE